MRSAAIDRLMPRVVETPGPIDTPCWIPNYYVNVKGYAQMGGNTGVATTCHRVAYEATNGPVPRGLCIDHLCRNRKCCNPAHLEAVTPRENNARGQSPAWVAHRTNICGRGHSLDDAYIFAGAGRRCRTCFCAYMRARRRTARLEAAAS